MNELISRIARAGRMLWQHTSAFVALVLVPVLSAGASIDNGGTASRLVAPTDLANSLYQLLC